MEKVIKHTTLLPARNCINWPVGVGVLHPAAKGVKGKSSSNKCCNKSYTTGQKHQQHPHSFGHKSTYN